MVEFLAFFVLPGAQALTLTSAGTFREGTLGVCLVQEGSSPRASDLRFLEHKERCPLPLC